MVSLGAERVPAAYLVDVFDLLNVRDLDLIAQASAQCAHLIVCVCSDNYAEQLLGRRPVIPEHERSALVQRVRGVHEVMIYDGDIELGGAPGLFFVPDDRPALARAEATVLRPRRHTQSELLQNALGSAPVEAVA